MVGVGRVDLDEVVVPGLDAGSVALPADALLEGGAAVGELRGVGDRRPRPIDVAVLRDVDAGEDGAPVGRALVEQHGRLDDGVELLAVGGVGELGVSDLLGVDRAARVDLAPGRPGVVGAVEAVVGVATAPGDVGDEVPAGAVGLHRDVVDDVLVRRIGLVRVRATRQVAGVRGIEERPATCGARRAVRVDAAVGRGVDAPVAVEAQLVDDGALELAATDPVGRGEGAARRVGQPVDT